jgi:uncharacterized RDD family membrane protein YckC
VAYLIYSLVAFLVFVLTAQLLVFVPLRHLLIGSEDWFRSGRNTQIYTLLTMSLPAYLYFALSEISPSGATLGKRLLNLKTVTKGTQGKMTLPQSLARTLFKLLPSKMAQLDGYATSDFAELRELETRELFSVDIFDGKPGGRMQLS